MKQRGRAANVRDSLVGRLILDHLDTFRCKGISRIDLERVPVVVQCLAEKSHALIVSPQSEVRADATSRFESLGADSDSLFAVTACERSIGRLQEIDGRLVGLALRGPRS